MRSSAVFRNASLPKNFVEHLIAQESVDGEDEEGDDGNVSQVTDGFPEGEHDDAATYNENTLITRHSSNNAMHVNVVMP